MSYYSNSGSEGHANLIMIAICIVLVLAIMIGTNSCSSDVWNDGICPKCEVRYELRGASNSLKYYSCPACGQEVQRY